MALDVRSSSASTPLPAGGTGVKGLEKLNRRLRKMALKHGVIEDVIVGYTQWYAIYVHERVEMSWKGKPRQRTRIRPSIGRYWDPPGAQAKFLEKPAREMAGSLGKFIGALMATGTSFQEAVYKAGQKLQYASQRLVPIDFGALIASAYTAKESEEAQVAGRIHQQSEFLRPKG